MERAVVRRCVSSASRYAERFCVAQDCQRQAPIYSRAPKKTARNWTRMTAIGTSNTRDADVKGNGRVSQMPQFFWSLTAAMSCAKTTRSATPNRSLYLKKWALHRSPAALQSLAAARRFSRPFVVVAGQFLEAPSRLFLYRAEHDLPTVGVCVAGATPPVDKSAIVYLSCSKNKRLPVPETKPTPTQIESFIPHNFLYAIPRQSRLDAPERGFNFLVVLHAVDVFNHAARKGNCNGFELQSPRSPRC